MLRSTFSFKRERLCKKNKTGYMQDLTAASFQKKNQDAKSIPWFKAALLKCTGIFISCSKRFHIREVDAGKMHQRSANCSLDPLSLWLTCIRRAIYKTRTLKCSRQFSEARHQLTPQMHPAFIFQTDASMNSFRWAQLFTYAALKKCTSEKDKDFSPKCWLGCSVHSPSCN